MPIFPQPGMFPVCRLQIQVLNTLQTFEPGYFFRFTSFLKNVENVGIDLNHIYTPFGQKRHVHPIDRSQTFAYKISENKLQGKKSIRYLSIFVRYTVDEKCTVIVGM
jgi:hypothetical protein